VVEEVALCSVFSEHLDYLTMPVILRHANQVAEVDNAEYNCKILCFWTLSIVLSLYKNTVLFIFEKRFGEWILSSSSGKTYSVRPNP
jgi:hypothetical protein